MSKLRFLGLDVHADTIAAALPNPAARSATWESSRTGWSRFANS